jgi:flagellar hook-basal body complex protein FliE
MNMPLQPLSSARNHTEFEQASRAFDAQFKTGLNYDDTTGIVTPQNVDASDTQVAALDAQIRQQNRAASMGGGYEGFGDTLKQELSKVNATQMDANASIQDYATGGDTPLHQVMLSINKAELSLQLATQVRNKLVNAYQDISRMQI